MILCIYHKNCVDGLASAAIVQKALGTTIAFHAASYGDAPPDVTGYDIVYIVDFRYDLKTLFSLLGKVKHLIILDHHKTAMEDLAEIRDDKATIVFDVNRSGAGITWDYFFKDTPRPQIITHIEDRDLWRFAHHGSKDLHYVLAMLPNNVNDWMQIFDWNIDEKLAEGSLIHNYFMSNVFKLAKFAYSIKIGGYTVPVCNAPAFFSSELGGHLAQGQAFAATYYDDGTREIWGLRSSCDGIDVSLIAKQYGGGGHYHAAGFEISYVDSPRRKRE